MPAYSTAGFERLEVSVAGIRTVAYRAGHGPDVVYWHGGGTYHGFEWARDWLDGFRVLLPYHPGFGESADAPALATLADYVRHHRALVDALGLNSFHLAGASLGGRLAAEFATAHPTLVQSLTLVSPGGIVSARHPMPDLTKLTHADWPAQLVYDRKIVEPFWPANPDEGWKAARSREARSVGRLLQSGGLSVHPLEAALGRLTIPTLLLWGEEDRMVPVAHAAEWQALIPGARVHRVPRAGHLLLDESPAARAVALSFMRQQQGTTP